MAKGERDYGNQSFKKGLKAVQFFCTGDILAWKSVKEVANGAGLTPAEAHAAIHTLLEAALVEKGPKGFRAHKLGWVQYALAMLACLEQCREDLGLGLQHPETR